MTLPIMDLGASGVFALMILSGAGLFALILLIPFYAIWTSHKRHLEEIKARQRVQINEETKAAIEALREEFKALRDTTTQYDVSFDTALRRLESRVGHLEQRVGQSVYGQQDASEIQSVGR